MAALDARTKDVRPYRLGSTTESVDLERSEVADGLLAEICAFTEPSWSTRLVIWAFAAAIAAWLASMAAWAFLADHVHFDGVRGVLGIHLHDDAFCRLLG